MTRYHVVEETSGGAEILASYPSAGQALKTAATITAPTSVGVLVYVIDDAGLAVVDELGEDVEDLADNDPDIDMVALAVGQGVLW